MRVNKEAQKRKFSVYQELKQTVMQQELWRLVPFREIYEWLCGQNLITIWILLMSV